jgi:hypothetical protein
MSFDIFRALRETGHIRTIWLYPSKEVINDPYESTTTKQFQNPLPVKVFLKTISPDALRWKYFGNLPMGTKEVIFENRYIDLFKVADKIKIDNTFYKTWKDDERGFGIITREDYTVAILKVKGNNEDD